MSFNRLDNGLLRWFFETHVPLECYPFCELVNKQWRRHITSIYPSMGTRAQRKSITFWHLIGQKETRLLQWLWGTNPITEGLWRVLCIYSARRGYDDILKWSYTYHPHICGRSILWHVMFEEIGRGGSTACLTWAIDRAIQGPTDMVSAMDYHIYLMKATNAAIDYGRISILKWIKDRQPDIANRSLPCCRTLTYGHWDCFVWCYDNGLVRRYSDIVCQGALCAAAEYGDLSMFEKLVAHPLFHSQTQDFDHWAARLLCDDNQPIIDVENRYICGSEGFMMSAIKSKKLPMIKEAVRRGALMTHECLYLAIEMGLVDVLQWLYDEKRYAVTEDMVELAQSNHIPAMACIGEK